MPEFEIVGQADDGLEALDVISRTQPDVVLLDVNMPRMDGIETIRALRKKDRCKVLMLTISKRDQDLISAIREGADGYLLKNAEPDELRKSILLVAGGTSVLSPEVTGQVMQVISKGQGADLMAAEALTPREKQVLDCLAKGMTTSQIADSLFISDNTVKTHVRHIMEKLEAATRAEAVSKATQMGLIGGIADV
jgi:DNA-binding NarL/FixJ family response regulator